MSVSQKQRIDLPQLECWAESDPQHLKKYVRNRLLRQGSPNPPLSSWSLNAPSTFLIGAFSRSTNDRFKAQMKSIAAELVREWMPLWTEKDEREKEYLGELARLCEAIRAEEAREDLKDILIQSEALCHRVLFSPFAASWLRVAVACLPTDPKTLASESDLWLRQWKKSENQPELEHATFTALRRANYKLALQELPEAYRRACRDEEPFDLIEALHGLVRQPDTNIKKLRNAIREAEEELLADGTLSEPREFISYTVETLQALNYVKEAEFIARQSNGANVTTFFRGHMKNPIIELKAA